MRKVAAHYLHLFPGSVLTGLYYLTLNNEGFYCGHEELKCEIESVTFYNGILFLIEKELDASPASILSELHCLQRQNPVLSAFQIIDLSGYAVQDILNCRKAVDIILLDGLDLSSPKFCTDDGCCYGHIQRL